MSAPTVLADHVKVGDRLILETISTRGRQYTEVQVDEVSGRVRRLIHVMVGNTSRAFSDTGSLKSDNRGFITYTLKLPTPELEARLKRGQLLAATELRLHQLSALLGLNELSILDMEDFLEKTASLIPGDGR